MAFSLTGLYSVVGEAVRPDQAGMAQGVNSLVVGLGSATGSAAVTSLLSARVIPHTPLSVPSGYTYAYIMCGLLGRGRRGQQRRPPLAGHAGHHRGIVQL